MGSYVGLRLSQKFWEEGRNNENGFLRILSIVFGTPTLLEPRSKMYQNDPCEQYGIFFFVQYHMWSRHSALLINIEKRIHSFFNSKQSRFISPYSSSGQKVVYLTPCTPIYKAVCPIEHPSLLFYWEAVQCGAMAVPKAPCAPKQPFFPEP